MKIEKNTNTLPWYFPWESEDLPKAPFTKGKDCATSSIHDHLTKEVKFSMDEVSYLLDRMITDIQHLELEVVRTRYRLSLYLEHPYNEYLRMEIFSGLGGRYGDDPVYNEYLIYRGLSEYDDAIDTPFHIKRMQRLANGYDDYPDLYP